MLSTHTHTHIYTHKHKCNICKHMNTTHIRVHTYTHIYIYTYIYTHHFFIHSLVSEYLDCFHILATVNYNEHWDSYIASNK